MTKEYIITEDQIKEIIYLINQGSYGAVKKMLKQFRELKEEEKQRRL